MSSRPTISPSPGQFVRSARSFVELVMVAPQASSLGTCGRGYGQQCHHRRNDIPESGHSRDNTAVATSITRSHPIASCSARSWLATTSVPR